MIVATAAFYPAFGSSAEAFVGGGSSAMNAVLGLGSGIDPGAPLGYLWIGLYANVLPWTLMALGVAVGSASIAGDEDTGTLEYLLAGPVTRTQVVISRFAAAITVLLVVSVLSGVSMAACLPAFQLADATTITLPDGTTSIAPGATVADIVNGTISSFAVALGLTGLAFLIGAVSGRKSWAIGGASAIGIGGYVLYTLSSMTSSLDALTWFSPWRWYVDDVMLINGLTPEVLIPFGTATVSLLVGWWVFLHRDLQTS